MWNLWKTLKTHPKKSIVALGLSVFAYDYLTEKYRTLLKCFEANVAPILQLSGLDVQMVYTDNDLEVKDFVSILDPATTDGILIASDDHVLQKTVTALLQRTDFLTSKVHALPVGVVPVGVWNTVASSYSSCENLAQWCFDTLNPLLQQTTKRHHVLEISIIQPPSEQSTQTTLSPDESESHATIDPQPVIAVQSAKRTYALLGLEWSTLRDVELGGGAGAPTRKSKPINTNEHRGPLLSLDPLSPRTWSRHFGLVWRQCWFWIRSTSQPISQSDNSHGSFYRSIEHDSATPLKRRYRSKRAKLVYTPECPGCSRCWESRQEYNQPLASSPSDKPVYQSSTTFGRLFGLSRQTNSKPIAISPPSKSNEASGMIQEVEVDHMTLINDQCGQEYTVQIEDSASVLIALDKDRIRLDLETAPHGLWHHLRHTYKQLKSEPYKHKDSESMDTNSNSLKTIYCSTVTLYPEITENEFYWIDNDHFEACPVQVRVVRNAINMYT